MSHANFLADQVAHNPDSHLDRLLAPQDLSLPWYRSFLSNLREMVAPAPLPPLQVTSQPVAVKDIWGIYGRQKKSFAFSLALQCAAVAILFTALSNPVVQNQVRQVATLVLPADLVPAMAPKPRSMQGGGGGGDRSPLPASKGRLPKAALRQFVPPSAVVLNPAPRLSMEPSIIAPPDVSLPNVNMANYGDPLGRLGPPSNGTGSGGGIGSGKGGGVGSGTGAGVGPGEGGGIGGGVYSVGGGVTAPVAIYRPDPEYSEEARKAKIQGTVVLEVVVDESGRVRNPKILQSLGLGLEEQAIKTILTWKFKPAMKGGKPVAVSILVHTLFRLL
jgi:periplasmic protein TonB